MASDISPEHRARITSATEDLTIAQREVEKAMRELTQDTPRAQKIIITEVLKVAFEKLAEARSKLEVIVSSDP
jgi:hypothetical protein